MDTEGGKMVPGSQYPVKGPSVSGAVRAISPDTPGEQWAQYINRLAWTCQLN